MIKLNGHYRNASVSIPEGIYEETDPLLHGLAGYLLSTEQAVRIQDAPLPVAGVDVEEVPTPENTEQAVAPKAPRKK